MTLEGMARLAQRTMGLSVLTVMVVATLALQLLLAFIVSGLTYSAAMWVAARTPLEPLLMGLAVVTLVMVFLWASRVASHRLPGFHAGVLLGVSAFAAVYQPWALLAMPLLVWFLLTSVVGYYALGAPVGQRAAIDDAGGVEANYQAVRPRYKASDVVGMQGLMDELAALAARNANSKGAQARNGILLHGDPGNGKTMYAHVLADRLRLPIIEAELGSIKSRWINQSAEQIAKMFEDARRQAPCVLFLDEATSLLANRSGPDVGHSEDKKATDAFLQALDRIRGCGVVVVAACNHLDQIDPAAIRPGRFDDHKLIPPPDAAARAGMVERAVKAAKLQLAPDAIASVNPWWEGFSVAMVQELSRKSVDLARSEGQGLVSAESLERALRMQQGGESELRAGVPSLDGLVQTAAVGHELQDLSQMLANAKTLMLRGGKVERGVVFAGPPGTGKTVSAQALAKSVDWNFVSTSGPALLDPARIDEVFTKAARLRPCVVLIDEAEAALGQRGMGGYDSVTAKMLTMLDGADNRSIGLFFVVCTNHPEALDAAIVRPGRLGRTITFENADENTANELAQLWAKTKQVRLNVPTLGSKLAGKSFADITHTLEQAFNRAVLESSGGGVEIQARHI
jgi:transitional endoplasmic reticulum ATPase